LSWVTDFWKVVETAATLTRDVQRAESDVKELRRDVNTLALTLSQLRSDLSHEKAITRLALDKFETDGQHLKESIDSRFDVLLTRLDSKLAAFESHLPTRQSEKKTPQSLKGKSDD
jgi:chromosome segregation ATPase